MRRRAFTGPIGFGNCHRKARFPSEQHDFEQCKAVFLKRALHLDRNEERTRIDPAVVLEKDYMLYVEEPPEAWRAAILTCRFVSDFSGAAAPKVPDICFRRDWPDRHFSIKTSSAHRS
jgi:hypothetical protein